MKRWLRRVVTGWWVVLCLWCAAGGAVAGHDFTGLCEGCHLGETGGGEMIFVDNIDSLCRDCHYVARTNSHPSGMAVERELPPQFELDIEGRMTCSTCHNPCLEPTDANPYLLIGYDGPTEFCAQCHAAPTFCAGDGEAIFELTHAKAWTPSTDGGSSIDHVSLDCISCHDGGNGPQAEYKLHSSVSSTGGNLDAIHTNHPVGQDYAGISSTNMRLRSLDDLSPQISLIEGKVGCASCHSPYSKEPQFLVFNNRERYLCQECHLM